MIDARHPHQQADQLLAELRDAVKNATDVEVNETEQVIASATACRRNCAGCRAVRNFAVLGLLQALCAARDLKNDREPQ